LVRDVAVLNVYTGTVLPHRYIATAGPLIALVTPEEVSPGPQTVVLDGRGKYAVPGFIDAHAHLDESTLVVPEYLRYSLPRGNTAFITESMEVTNALGHPGIIWFLDSCREQPAHLFVLLSPMVPGHPEILVGHRVSFEQVAELLRRPEVLGLGESYWTRVVHDQGELASLFYLAEELGKAVEGHGAGAKTAYLNALAASGVDSCHEAITPEEVEERLAAGIFTMLREGSIRRDLEALAPLASRRLDFRLVGLCTDGVNPVDLLRLGTMDYAVQKAIEVGFDPVTAIQMATINNATHFRLDRYLGSITPGRYADFLLLEDLRHIKPTAVVAKGRLVARDGELLLPPKSYRFPEEARRLLNFSRRFSPEELKFAAPTGRGSVRVRVIHQRDDVVTEERFLDLEARNGELVLPPGVNKAVSVSTLDPSVWSLGLVSGWNLTAGACATSATWDAPQISGVGATEEELARAANRVAELGGGVVVCEGGRIVAELPLPVGGTISHLPAEEVASRMESIILHLRRLGYPYPNPLLALRVLGFVGVPRLRLTAKGLVTVGSRGSELVRLVV
jgi:adenine deaminase